MNEREKYDPWRDPSTVFDGRGKKNRYTCEKCSGSIVTEDIDHGTTPAFIGCRATVGCSGLMESSFYRTAVTIPADGEWYRPTRAETACKSPEEREHIEAGGLVLRHNLTGKDWLIGARVSSGRHGKRAASLKPKRRGVDAP